MFKYLIITFITAVLLASCSRNEEDCNTCKADNSHLLDSLKTLEREKQDDSVESKLMQESNLVDIQTFNSQIMVDLKYAGTDNFMKMKLYERLDKAYLQKDVAERLAKCQTFLKSINPDLHLLVYDAVRPVSVQQKMWDALDSIPVAQRTKFVSNPANGSIHNYGAAVDLTICDVNGTPIDMGAEYDDIRQIAYPRLEAQFLASGELTQEQINNRKLLRKVMISQGFTNITTEWWHFNACTRAVAKEKYLILSRE